VRTLASIVGADASPLQLLSSVSCALCAWAGGHAASKAVLAERGRRRARGRNMLAVQAMGRSPAIRALTRVCIALVLLAASAVGQSAQEVCPLAYQQEPRHACETMHRRDCWRPSPVPYFSAS